MIRHISSGNRTKIIGITVVLVAILSAPLTRGVAETIPHPKFVPQYSLDELLARLPTGERWLTHLRDDLLPFWLMESAIGNPRGNFPTYRCNDGSLIDPAQLCPEQRYAASGIVFVYPEYRQYLRALSRQVYAYAVAFHMTGDESLLKFAYARRRADGHPTGTGRTPRRIPVPCSCGR